LQPDQLDKIFDRFYQVDESSRREHEGSGIGLALTKELVELHQGEIFVDSKPGKGTTFTVRLPMGRDHLTDKEIVSEDFEKAKDIALEADVMKTTVEEDYGPKEPQNKKAPILLIVEDNRDLRDYICDILSAEYRVKQAPDGEKGLELAFNIIPDLIISDVMMPRLDGIEFCRRLKTDERTSHIPVILLTARAGLESKLEGLETGADDYIIKPFNTKELVVRVVNLLENRRKTREQFRINKLNLKDIAVTSTDEKFLQRACEIIDRHLSDPDYDVPHFIKDIGASRTQLHRKLRAVMNLSATEFIRTIRLKRAEELIRARAGNVTEIAFKVGFSSTSYFSKCFRQQFGVPPSTYGKKSRTDLNA
jgi:DNA-binding response OmpR family regulator